MVVLRSLHKTKKRNQLVVITTGRYTKSTKAIQTQKAVTATLARTVIEHWKSTSLLQQNYLLTMGPSLCLRSLQLSAVHLS